MKKQKRLRLLKDLLRNSKRSGREIAKNWAFHNHRTRTCAQLEKGFIKTYTVIPDFAELGYHILAFSFAKKKSCPPREEKEKIMRQAKEWNDKHSNIVFALDGEGIGKSIVMMSFHKTYDSCGDFMRSFAMDRSVIIGEFNSS